MARPSDAVTGESLRAPLFALAALALARLVVAGTTGIVEDEAYYWVWSQHLAAGYFDHPPAIAWTIALSDAVFGATSLGVRGGPVLAGTLAAAALFPFARDRWLLLLLLGAMPLYTLGGVLATPDAPMLLGWAIGLAGALRGNFLVAGLGIGLAGLGKYTGWGLWPLLFLAEPRRWRAMLPGVAVTLLVLAPNLLWNAAHDWVSVRFQLDHGLGRAPPGLGGLAAWLGGQVGLVSPVLFGAAAAWWAVGWRGDRVERICWWASFPVFVFFAFAATRSTGEPNWTAPAWLGAFVGLARASGRLARAAWVGGGLAAALSALVVAHLYRPLLAIPGDPTARLGLGRDLAASVEAWGVEPIYAERYQEAAILTFYEGLDAWGLPGAGRADQYDLWDVPNADEALFVRPWRSGDTLPTDTVCAERGSAEVVTERDAAGLPLARWQVVPVSGCDVYARFATNRSATEGAGAP